MEPVQKRRKWDVAAPGGLPATAVPGAAAPSIQPAVAAAVAAAAAAAVARPSLTEDAIKRAQEAAAAIVNKLTSETGGRGFASTVNRLTAAVDNEICREVTINDAPSGIRYHLTKRTTQDDIQRKTGTVIVTRGRYYPPGAPLDDKEKPLFLRITPGAEAGQADDQKHYAVSAAATEIQRILQGEQARGPGTPPPMMATPAPPRPAAGPSTIVWVGFETPPDFGLAGRIRGPGDSYLSHIASQTSCMVQLRGRGSGVIETQEPLHLFISGPNPKGVDDAARLAQDLIKTIRDDYEGTYQRMPPAPQPSHAPYAQTQPPPAAHPGYGAAPPPGAANAANGMLPPGAPQARPGMPALYPSPYPPGNVPGYAPAPAPAPYMNHPPQTAAPAPAPYSGYPPQPVQGTYPPGPYPSYPQQPAAYQQPAPGAYQPAAYPYQMPGQYPPTSAAPAAGPYAPPGMQPYQMQMAYQQQPPQHQQPQQMQQQQQPAPQQSSPPKRRFSEKKETDDTQVPAHYPPPY